MPIEKKKLQELIKKEKKWQKRYLSDYNFLQFITIFFSARFMTRSLPRLVITFLQEFIKLNVNMEMIVKNVKRAELNKKIANAALDIKTLKMIY